MSVCLDSFALLAWLQNEISADEVERYFERTANEEGFKCYLSTINLGEVFYRLVRIKGVDEAEAFWEDAISGELPIVLVEPTRNRVLEAARLRGQHPIAFADAFAAQVARENSIPVATGDPEMRILEEKGLLSVIWLKRK